MVKLKRAYDTIEKSDGYRVLIDRLWPRGVKKEDLKLDEWAKELAPSTELRKAFGHDPEKWSSFRSHYQLELRAAAARRKLEQLIRLAGRGTVTLIYSAHDQAHNDAIVLKEIMDRKLSCKAAA